MSRYTPDNWVVVQVRPDLQKVLAGWNGGYLEGDRWQMNSGIVKTNEFDDYYEFVGHSGSVYKCYKSCQRLSGMAGNILAMIQEKHPDVKIVEDAKLFHNL